MPARGINSYLRANIVEDLFSMSGRREKEQLVRRLLKARVARDPSARAMGQGPEFADRVNAVILMGLPEASIVTCVEAWAQLGAQGLTEPAIAQRIAALRHKPYHGGGVADVIRACVRAEHGHSTFLPVDHIDWCILQACAAYGLFDPGDLPEEIESPSHQFATALGQAMVELADDALSLVCEYCKADRRLIRLNLIAFCVFGLGSALAHKLEEHEIDGFGSVVIEGAASRCGISDVDQAIQFLRSRFGGFLAAATDSKTPLGLRNYFEACCSVDRIEIGYEDIYPDPKDLERIGILFGPADAVKEMARKIREMQNPAIYPNSPSSQQLHGVLIRILNHIEQFVEQFGR